MTKPALPDVTPLDAQSAAALGLFTDADSFTHGGVRLILRRFANCRTIARPFYEFDIADATTNSIIGEITFTPETNAAILGEFGNSGGGLVPEARGRGLYGDALKALAQLAARHGLNEFLIAIPQDNAPALRAVENLRLRQVDAVDRSLRFAVPSPPTQL